jgi:hypothetical protein
MKIFVDVDETICCTPSDRDYSESEPITKNIALVNELYDDGHTITYYTARGSASGKDWRELTEKQLDQWGCKRHALDMSKPAYDLLIDDRTLNSRVWEKNGNDVARRIFLQASQFSETFPQLDPKDLDLSNAFHVINPCSCMGIGPIGGNIIFKRKYRWTFEAKFPDGLEIKPCFIKISERPGVVGDAEGIHYIGPIEVTIYCLNSECELSQTIANLTEQILGNKEYIGEGKLIMYDGCGNPMETWELRELQVDQMRYEEYPSDDEFNFTFRVQFADAKYASNWPKLGGK